MRLAQKIRGIFAVNAGPSSATIQANSATRLMDEAARLEQIGQSDEALRVYERALDEDPSLALAHFKRGVIFLDLGAAQQALDAFGLALASKPQSAGTHFNMGNAHLALGDLSAAIDAYEKSISIKPDFIEAKVALDAAKIQQIEFVDYLFNSALAHQDENNKVEAEKLLRRVLDLDPGRAEAHSNLGGILLRNGNLDDAALHFAQASSISPENADIQTNLGIALRLQNRLDAAKLCFEKSIQLDASNATTWLYLGGVQLARGQFFAAITSYSKSIELDSREPEAHLNLSAALIETEDYVSAEISCLRAIELDPDSAAAHCKLGVVLRRIGRLSESLKSFQKAISLNPVFFEAIFGSAMVFAAFGQFEAALAAYKEAVALNPESAVAHSNLGALLIRLERFAEAEISLSKALTIDVHSAKALNNMGLVYSSTRRMHDAVEYFERAVKIEPEYADAFANLGGLLKDLGELERAQATLTRALDIDPGNLDAHNNLLFTSNYLADQPSAVLLLNAKRYGETVSRLAKPFCEWNNSRILDRELRVGLVSGDLGSHPVGYFLISVLRAFASSKASRIQIYAYSNKAVEDGTSQKLKSYCTQWQCIVGFQNEELARQIHDVDSIDILIDLSGHTANNRLPVFSWRPAPIQLCWLGYFATTGVSEMDYFVADPWTLPAEQEVNFTEKIWRLPETRLCFTAPDDASLGVSSLPALSKGFITFGCFNNLSKMNDEVVSVWAKILHKVPSSRLFLKYMQLGDATIRSQTVARFARHGITPERLVLEDYEARAQYLAAYHRVDIALDPFPFPGGTTTAEALWMGVPVLTLSGDRFLSRQGVGLLANAGLSDWITSNLQDYVDQAVFHATDLQLLASLRSRLRQKVLASPIFDAQRFADHFEAALRDMWHIWCRDANTLKSQAKDSSW